MRSLKEQIMGRCRHYAAPFDHDKCEVGVTYESLRTKTTRSFDWPCFKPGGGDCSLASFPSEAEADAEVKRCDDRIAQIGTARRAIIDSKKKHGRIPCPVCLASGETLQFSISSYNGHVHASCSTPDCVRWME